MTVSASSLLCFLRWFLILLVLFPFFLLAVGEFLGGYTQSKAKAEKLQRFAYRKCVSVPYSGMCAVVELPGLQPDTQYHVRASASNIKGEGPLSSRLAFKTMELITE